MEIVEFIRARLAEDEKAAREAAERSPDWWVSEEKWSGGVLGGERTPAEPEWGAPEMGEYTIVYDEGYPLSSEAEHIARHDPARVLRQCAMVRAMLEHASTADLVSSEQSGATDDQMFRDIAAVWSDHPDYRPEWAQG